MKKKSVIVDYNQIERQVWDLAEPLVAAAGAELIDVEYAREAGEWYLRLFIDRADPVDHALCERVSRLLDPALDKADFIQQSYYLEISSPGLERPLKRAEDFRRYAGAEVAVRLYAPQNGVKEAAGQLVGLDGTELVILSAEGEQRFPLDSVAKVRLVADLD